VPWHGSAEQRQRRRPAKELPLTQAWRVCLGDRRDVRTAAVDITTEWMPRLDGQRSPPYGPRHREGVRAYHRRRVRLRASCPGQIVSRTARREMPPAPLLRAPMVLPPLTSSDTPVVRDACSETKKPTASATTPGVATPPMAAKDDM
jgi:hypothetical protein